MARERRVALWCREMTILRARDVASAMSPPARAAEFAVSFSPVGEIARAGRLEWNSGCMACRVARFITN